MTKLVHGGAIELCRRRQKLDQPGRVTLWVAGRGIEPTLDCDDGCQVTGIETETIRQLDETSLEGLVGRTQPLDIEDGSQHLSSVSLPQMRRQRLLWIYSGLGVPEGHAGARKKQHIESLPKHVLLVGDELAERLSLPLGELAENSKVTLTFRRITDHVEIKKLAKSCNATSVILALREPPQVAPPPWLLVSNQEPQKDTVANLAECAGRLWSIIS